jgi:CelD/BcsL family acetyltransferase involved in cellulose biosynthesis
VNSTGPSLLVTDHLGGWERQWDQLVDLSPLPSPFLRSWWLKGTQASAALFLLVVSDGQLLGGLALEEGRRLGLKCYQLSGSHGHLCPDHLDLLAAPGYEDTTTRLLRGWLGRPGSRLLDLTGVRGGSRLIEALPGWAHLTPFAVAPWTPLPDDPDAYLASLPSQFRRQVRRASARLTAAGARHRARRGQSAIDALETLRALHQRQWGDRSRFLPDFDRFVAACRLGAAADEVVVHELGTDSAVIALLVAFEVAGRVSLYQSARSVDSDWREAASVLLTTVITEACGRGFVEVDFLRGDEPYKGRYAQRRRQMIRLLAGNGGAAHVVSTALTTVAAARPTVVQFVRATRSRFWPAHS